MEMANIPSGSGASAQATMNAIDISLLKKSQDLAKSMSQQLLATLPPAGAPSMPGVGANIDIRA